MAPASASPQPPPGRPDEVGHGGQAPEATRPGEHDQPGHAQRRQEVYGPLSIERHLKQDGRSLILYARQSQDV